MALDHLCVSSRTVNIQAKAAFHSTDQLRSGLKLNQRVGRAANKADIDKDRTYLNQELLCKPCDEIYLDIANRISGKAYTLKTVPPKEELRYESGRKIRSDAVLGFEIETSYPGDMVWSMFDGDPNNREIVPVPDHMIVDAESIKDKKLFLMPADMNEFNEWRDSTKEFILVTNGIKSI